jgi:transcription termination/antitermination protein NusG
MARSRFSQTIKKGDAIRVSGGPFAGFHGTVEEVDPAHARFRVAVSIFGRDTPVELKRDQIEKR